MKNRTLIFITVLSIIFFSSPIFAQVKSDYDKTADFSKYKSYSFSGWQKDSDKQLTDFDKKRILESLKTEFDAREMNLADNNADATITIYVVVDNKTSTTAYTDFNGGMGYGMGYGRGYGWGMGMGGMGMGSTTTNYVQNDYKEGTLVVDMYDETTKKLLWQGVITTVVKEKPAKRDKQIPVQIKKMMKQFPVAIK